MEQEKEKKSKKTLIIVIIVALLIIAAACGGFYLGGKYGSNNKQEVKESEQKEEKETKEEKECETEPEKEKEPEEPEDTRKTKPLPLDDANVEKAFKLVNLIDYETYIVADEIYAGKDLDLTKIKDNTKMEWTLLSILKEIPVCTDDSLTIEQDRLNALSFFEDKTYIDNVRKTGGTSEGVISLEYMPNDSVFVAKNGNCDGYGPGPSPYSVIELESASQDGDNIIIEVKYAYYLPTGEYDEATNTFYYDVNRMHGDNGTTILRRGVQASNDFKYGYATYEFTFKVGGNKVYPLSVKYSK